MKKRVFSLILSLCMVLALLPTSAFAAKAKFTVSSVAATVDAPTAGKTPGDVAPTLSAEDVTLYAYDWKDENGNVMSKNKETFESGKTYRLVILATTASKTFASNVRATVNGQTATVDERTDNTLRFSFDFTLDTTIDTVNFSVTPFYLGNTPQDISVTAAAGQHFTVQSVEITNADDNALANNHKFADRESVYVYVKLKADDGYTFPADYKKLNSYFDGKEGQEWPYTIDAKNVTVYMAYRVGAAATISRIDATVTEPVVGAKPSFTATLDPNAFTISDRQMGASVYTANGIGWLDLTTGKYMNASDTFQAGHSYQFSIGWLSPTAGNKLAADSSGTMTATAAVNGQSATISGSSNNFIVNYTFPALAEAKTLSSIAIAMPPSKTEYVAGFSFDPTGMTVIATYSDGSNATVTGYAVSPTILTADTKAVTVSYTEGSVTKTAQVPVTVTPAQAQQMANPFTDVPNVKDYYYYDPIIWAYYHEPQITTGTSATTFDLWMTCDRGQVVTFLWRAYGCPAPKGTANNFTDLTQDWYKTAVQWAVEQGITNGTGPNTFSPTKTCSVAEVITFLYRAAGSPGAAYNPLNKWYTDAMDWASSIGLIQGTSYDGVNPLVNCPRADIVTYLYRQFGK